MRAQAYSYYLAGVSGMGMCPLALYLAQEGHQVVGFDDHLRPDTERFLAASGVSIDLHAKIPQDTSALIYSSAIAENHPLRLDAEDRSIPCIRRGDFLAQKLERKRLIVVVGSHGKTTTCGLLISLLKESDFSFSYLLGALFQDPHKSPAKYEDADWVVAEIDESDGSIDRFSPEITLVVNFDWDHADRYPSAASLKSTFGQLFERTRQALFIPSNCQHLMDLVKDPSFNIQAQVHTFGQDGDFSSTLHQEAPLSMTLQPPMPSLTLPVPQGALFNFGNALGALALTYFLTKTLPARPLHSFFGIKRRLHWLYRSPAIEIMMDYAHHPAEIRALLDFAKRDFKGTLTALFQPHRYTRTQAFCQEFAESFLGFDQVFLLPVYSAFEASLEAGTSEVLQNAVKKIGKQAHLLEFSSEAVSEALGGIKTDQCHRVLFIGAGDIEQLAIEYAEAVEWEALAMKLSEETVLSKHEPLSQKTTLRTGGTARFYAEPEHLEDLTTLVQWAEEKQYPVFVLGRGSNLIVSDGGYEGLVIRLNHPNWQSITQLPDNRLRVAAGARLKEVCGQACKLGLAGFEFLEGIPGSIGGALRMNAGAMGGWFFDIVESVEYLDYTGKLHLVPVASLKLGYRYCEELEKGIALGAILKSPSVGEEATIRKKINDFMAIRKRSQPREPSAGCIFKNPEGTYAGQLIERSGLMGTRIGAAEVSSVHANFIINTGGASSQDVLSLVKHVRQEVHKATGVDLEPEVLLLGKSWKEIL